MGGGGDLLAQEEVRGFGSMGIPASMVGEIVESQEGMRVIKQGMAHGLTHPEADPFWAAFGKAASQGIRP